jgi:hypothetical protein
MSKKPVLIFPKPSLVSRTPLDPSRQFLQLPSTATQGVRLSTKFSHLDAVFNNETASFSPTIAGSIPEMILVFEIAGRLDDFFKAVSKTPGMEFLAEYQKEFTNPDAYFFRLDNSGELSQGRIENRVFLSMTNRTAIQELQRYWQQYQTSGDFRWGTSKFKNLFAQLKDIRPYSVSDRIKDTGIQEYLDELRSEGRNDVDFEIELVYRNVESKNDDAFNEVQSLLNNSSGRIIPKSRVIIKEIGYHAFIANAPINVFNDLTENTNVSFFKSNQILFFRPVGQTISKKIIEAPTPLEFLQNEESLISGTQTIVALLDGLPQENHPLLANRIIVDDPLEIADTYLVEGRLHGTGMASLIVHGDLNETPRTTLARPIYVHPIMILRRNGHYLEESLPLNKLPVDIVHCAIKRMFEGDNNSPPTAPTTRLINFSIGDRFRPFHFNISTWAKLLDWFSFKYNVLFIVSAGNYSEDITFDVPEASFNVLSADEKQKLITKLCIKENAYRKILTPAEAINVITVGATHDDKSPSTTLNNRIDLINNPNIQSMISRIGFGYSGSIKPEILMPGGKKFFRKLPIQSILGKTKLSIETFPNTPNPPGNLVAVPGSDGSKAYTSGTSNAAALTTRLGAMLHEVLESINDDTNTINKIDEKYFTVLIKTLLVHGASWGSAQALLINSMRGIPGVAANQRKKHIMPYIGYGKVNQDKVLYCTDHRVTLLGYGDLTKENAHEYRFPLPYLLSGRQVNKKLTITLGWMSPLNFVTQKYRQAHLFIDNLIHNEHVDLGHDEYDFKATKKGTVQHCCLKGDKADAYIDGSDIVIKVNCKEDASGLTVPIKYGLAVTLEIMESTGIMIYDEIKLKIEQRIRI